MATLDPPQSPDVYDRLFDAAREQDGTSDMAKGFLTVSLSPRVPSRGSGTSRSFKQPSPAVQRARNQRTRSSPGFPRIETPEDSENDDDDCVVVRSFSTTSRGLVRNRSKYRRSENTSRNASSSENDDDAIHYIPPGPITSHRDSETKATHLKDDEVSMCNVGMIGRSGVGITSLVQLFLDSDLFDVVEEVKGPVQENQIISVELDGSETLLHIHISETLPDAAEQDALLVVFSFADRASYLHALAVLQQLRQTRREDTPTILVGNKSDLVRTRQVTTDESRASALQYRCKYVETSCTLGHHVDELLAGVVTQVRMYRKKQTTAKLHRRGSDISCTRAALSMVGKVLRSPRHTKKKKHHGTDSEQL